MTWMWFCDPEDTHIEYNWHNWRPECDCMIWRHAIRVHTNTANGMNVTVWPWRCTCRVHTNTTHDLSVTVWTWRYTSTMHANTADGINETVWAWRCTCSAHTKKTTGCIKHWKQLEVWMRWYDPEDAHEVYTLKATGGMNVTVWPWRCTCSVHTESNWWYECDYDPEDARVVYTLKKTNGGMNVSVRPWRCTCSVHTKKTTGGMNVSVRPYRCTCSVHTENNWWYECKTLKMHM